MTTARWGTTRLKSVADCRFSNVDKLSEDGELPVRLCNYTDVYYNEAIVADRPFMQATATPSEVQRFRLAVDDVIITKDSETADDIGIATVVRESAPDLVCGYHLALLRPRAHRYSGPFLQRVLSSTGLRQQMSVRANGVTRFGLGQGAIGGLVIPDPPFDEQQRIAEFLDRKTAVIDELIAKKERLVALLAEKRQALITQLVTKGLDRSVPMKDSGIAWIGEVPAHWQVLPLRRVVREFVDYRGRTPTKLPSGVPLITAGAIKDGTIDHSRSPEFMAEDEYTAFMERGRPALGDLVFTTEAPLGEVALVEDASVAFAQRVILFRMNHRMQSAFLRLFYLSPAGRSEVASRASGSTASGIRADRLRASVVVVPPVAEQQQIVAAVDMATASTGPVIQATTTSIERLREYRQALITAAVTGQIDVSDERAVAGHDDRVDALGG